MRIKKYFAYCGVALIFLPRLKGSFLQGATFPDGSKIVMALTEGGKDADKFWFSLFHELAHIVLGHVGRAREISDKEEKAADAWSEDMLIAQEDFQAFKQNTDCSEQSVLKFAEAQGIAPGIVVGRMQREGLIKSSMLNNLKEQ